MDLLDLNLSPAFNVDNLKVESVGEDVKVLSFPLSSTYLLVF